MTVEPVSAETEHCGVHVQDSDGVCVEIGGQWHWLPWSVAIDLRDTLTVVIDCREPQITKPLERKTEKWKTQT